MTNDWPALRAILIQPLLLRKSQGAPWVSWMLLAMMCLSGVFMFAASGKGRAFANFLFGVALVLFLLLWWTFLVHSIVSQSTPSALRLIPRFHQRTRHVLVAVWLLASLLITASIGLLLGYPAHVFVVAGLVLVEIALLRNQRSSWFWIGLLIAQDFLPTALRDAVMQALLSDAAVLPGLIVLALRGRVALRRLASAGGTPAAPAEGRPLASVRGLNLPLPLHAVSRLLWSHASPELPMVAGLAVVAFAIRALAGDTVSTLRMPFAFIIVMQHPILIRQLVTSGYQRQGEQGLVRLAAGSPASTRLNRVLGGDLRMLGIAGWLWLAFWQCALMLLLSASLAEVIGELAVAACCLPLYTFILRDYAGGNAGRAMPLGYVMVMHALLLSLTVWASKGQWPLTASFALLAAAVMLALVLGSIRWRRMLAAPPAFPAGRLP